MRPLPPADHLRAAVRAFIKTELSNLAQWLARVVIWWVIINGLGMLPPEGLV